MHYSIRKDMVHSVAVLEALHLHSQFMEGDLALRYQNVSEAWFGCISYGSSTKKELRVILSLQSVLVP
jgi:hypothetical protein